MTYEDSRQMRLDQIEEGRRMAAITHESLNAPPIVPDNSRQSSQERAKNKPGRFWARSSGGVYMNQHRRRMNGG